MEDNTSGHGRGTTPRPTRRRHLRSLRRRTDELHLDVSLAVTRLDLLENVGAVALRHLRGLSAREAELGQMHPTGMERFQYAIDKVTQAMGVEVDELTRRWQKS
jgi:hypothetical protein